MMKRMVHRQSHPQQPSGRRRGVGPYEVEVPAMPRPRLPGGVVVRRDEDDLIDALSADLVVHADNCVRQFGDFHIALPGGDMFARLYRRLMYDPGCRWLPWRRTHLWLVEERHGGFEREDSNFRFVSELIADHADIPNEQVHPIFADAEQADADYAGTIRETLAWREPGQDRLDYVLLGLGADGCVAGLRPDAAAPGDEALVHRTTDGRVTMTPALINASRFIAILAVGPAVAGAIHRLAAGADVQGMPAAAIRPMSGELRWYLDADACGAPEP